MAWHDSSMIFQSREDAGQQLGRHLLRLRVTADLVLGLPRGGVMVAAEVARLLQRPLDALVVRKLGHPWHREFAVGAMAEDGTTVFDDAAVDVPRTELEEVEREEEARLAEYHTKFHPGGQPVLRGKRVLLVDDGLATGATMEAAVLAAKKQGAAHIAVAVPVASDNGASRLRRVADTVHTLLVDPGFAAVGQYYRSFDQTTDHEVIEILKAAPP